MGKKGISSGFFDLPWPSRFLEVDRARGVDASDILGPCCIGIGNSGACSSGADTSRDVDTGAGSSGVDTSCEVDTSVGSSR